VVGETIAGRYTLEELVGSGGMSSVYRAHDRLLERDVALKILHSSYREDEETIERFRREARSVAQLSHPNIVTIIDRGEEDDRQFIVFEYIKGETLKNCLAQRGALPPGDALAIAVDVGEALSYAHGHGIVHRDVKPQNVILNGNGAKVTDFGIARSVDVETDVTQTGTVIGTGDYIAPEQASGRPVVPASDVYGLGCVLFELLSGSTPYSGAGFVDVAMQHIHSPAPDVRERRRDVPPRVAAAVARAMAKDPADRFPSMDEFVSELRACLDELAAPADEAATAVVPRDTARAPRPAPASRPSRARRGNEKVVPVLLGLAVAGAVATVLVFLSSGPSSVLGTGSAGTKPVKLHGVASFDPEGDDGEEHSAEVPNATDGDPSTYWTTSSYRYPDGGLGKSGVGIVLDAGRSVELSRVTLVSDTPGFTAEIRAGDAPGGPFDGVAADAKTVESRTTFEPDGTKSQYWLVWITNLGANSAIHVNEIGAR
jgi:serine/threonine protein kinase